MLTFALFKSEPPSGRNPKWPLPQQWIYTQSNCVDCQPAFASKPAPTGECVHRCGLACDEAGTTTTHPWV
ncbi:hypothetical protein DXU77_17585 [Pseudomonas lactis]|nr:hypothetical protein [Pseudomonas lactis]